MHIQSILETTGLSKKEARIYLANLELGMTTISDISTTVRLPRTSCYEIIKSLIRKKLIHRIKISTKTLYKAENPESLLVGLKMQQTALSEIMPALQAKNAGSKKKTAIYSYQDISGIKTIFEDILARQYPLMAVTSLEDAYKTLGSYFSDFIQRRHKKNLRVQLLTYRSVSARDLKARDSSELRQTRFLPSDLKFNTANFIYGDRVAMISFNGPQPYGFIIDDPEITQTQKSLFELLWKHSTLE